MSTETPHPEEYGHWDVADIRRLLYERDAAQSTIADQAKEIERLKANAEAARRLRERCEEARDKNAVEIERLTATIAAKDEAIKRLNGWLDNDRRALGEEETK